MAEQVVRHEGSGAIAGERFTNASPTRSFPRGRVCRDPECSTILSIYNSGDYCGSHAPRTPQWARGRRRERAAQAS